MDDPYLVEQVISAYFESIQTEYNKLCKTIENKSIEDSSFILHSIQGLAGNIGALGVCNNAKKVSAFLKAKGFENSTPHLQMLQVIIDKYNKILADFLETILD